MMINQGILQKHVAFYGVRGGMGGLSPVMRNLINYTVRLGIRASLLVHQEPAELDLIHPDVDVVNLPEVPKDLRFFPLSSYLSKAMPSHLISNREWGNWNAFLAKRLSRSKTKLIFRVGNPLDITLKRRGPIKRAIRAKKIQISYKSAHLVICNSHKIKEDILTFTNCPKEKVVVLKNPTVADEIMAMANQEPAIPIEVEAGEKIIVAIGRLSRQKSFDTLIRAFRLVLDRVRARLLLVGEGKERAKLQGLCRALGLTGQVDFLGYQRNPYPYLRCAHLFVLSSAWEGSPNVLIEALALGTPVVATDCPSGPREILVDGRYGPLVPVGDHQRLASAMLEVLFHPLPPERLKEAARPFHAKPATTEYLRAMGVMTGE